MRLAGAVFLGEVVTIWTLVGFVTILAGCALVTRPDPRARATSGAGDEAADADTEVARETEPEHPTLDEVLDEPMPPTEPIVR